MTPEELDEMLRTAHEHLVEEIRERLDLEAGLADALFRAGAGPTPEAAAEQARRIVRDASEGGPDGIQADA